jgi:Flp pilus assembly protein TadB
MASGQALPALAARTQTGPSRQSHAAQSPQRVKHRTEEQPLATAVLPKPAQEGSSVSDLPPEKRKSRGVGVVAMIVFATAVAVFVVYNFWYATSPA